MQGNYNLYFVQNGKLEKIEYKSSFKIKLSKKEKEQLRQMRKHRTAAEKKLLLFLIFFVKNH